MTVTSQTELKLGVRRSAIYQNVLYPFSKSDLCQGAGFISEVQGPKCLCVCVCVGLVVNSYYTFT